MMNARERRDLEEYKAFYFKAQKAIEKMQEEARKIDADKCETEQQKLTALLAKVIYQRCINILQE